MRIHSSHKTFVFQAQRDAEREKELKLRHTSVQRNLPRPTEVTNTQTGSVYTVCASLPCSHQYRPMTWHQKLFFVDYETTRSKLQRHNNCIRLKFSLRQVLYWNNRRMPSEISLLPSVSAGKRVRPPSHLHGAAVRTPTGRGADQTGNDHNAAL